MVDGRSDSVGSRLGTSALRHVLPACLFLGAGTALLQEGDPLVPLDATAQSYLAEASFDSGKTYLAVRGLNAVVSVLQESQVSISPAGVGVNLAVGQVLDPLDDMTERLSDVLVLSTAVVGAYAVLQPLISAVSGLGLQLLLFTLTALFLGQGVCHWRNRAAPPLLLALTRSGLVIGGMLLGLRVMAPAATGLGHLADVRYIEPGRAAAVEVLEAATPKLGDLSTLPRSDGWLDTVTGVGGAALERAQQISRAMQALLGNAEAIIEALLRLFTLFVTRLILNAFLIPLGCVFVSWWVVRAAVGGIEGALRPHSRRLDSK